MLIYSNKIFCSLIANQPMQTNKKDEKIIFPRRRKEFAVSKLKYHRSNKANIYNGFTEINHELIEYKYYLVESKIRKFRPIYFPYPFVYLFLLRSNLLRNLYMYCNKMVSTPIMISSTSLSHSLYYRSILGSTFKKKDFLAPQCFVFYISTQYSIKNAYIYSMESIKSYFLHTTRVHLLPLITYLYLYYKITKIAILLILMTFSIHKDLVIMSHS